MRSGRRARESRLVRAGGHIFVGRESGRPSWIRRTRQLRARHLRHDLTESVARPSDQYIVALVDRSRRVTHFSASFGRTCGTRRHNSAFPRFRHGSHGTCLSLESARHLFRQRITPILALLSLVCVEHRWYNRHTSEGVRAIGRDPRNSPPSLAPRAFGAARRRPLRDPEELFCRVHGRRRVAMPAGEERKGCSRSEALLIEDCADKRTTRPDRLAGDRLRPFGRLSERRFARSVYEAVYRRT